MGPASTPCAAIESVAAPLRTSTPGQSISFGVFGLAFGLLSAAGGPKSQDFILSVMSCADAGVTKAAHSTAARAILGITLNLVLPATIIHPSSTKHDPSRKNGNLPFGIMLPDPCFRYSRSTLASPRQCTQRSNLTSGAAKPSAHCSDAQTADGPATSR